MRVVLVFLAAIQLAAAADPQAFTYKLLATTRPQAMEKEMNEAASSGYSYAGLVGGNTEWGGREILTVMAKPLAEPPGEPKVYKILQADSPSSLEKKLEAAGSDGFEYRTNSVFQHGTNDVVVVMERDPQAGAKKFSYRLLTAGKTSAMDQDLQTAGRDGYMFLGVTLSSSFLHGRQVVSIFGKQLR